MTAAFAKCAEVQATRHLHVIFVELQAIAISRFQMGFACFVLICWMSNTVFRDAAAKLRVFVICLVYRYLCEEDVSSKMDIVKRLALEYTVIRRSRTTGCAREGAEIIG